MNFKYKYQGIKRKKNFVSLVVVIENESDRERETIKPEKRSRCLSFGCKLLKSSILTYHIGKIDEVMILGIMHGACCYTVIWSLISRYCPGPN